MRVSFQDLWLVMCIAASTNALALGGNDPVPQGIDPAAAQHAIAQSLYQGNDHASDLLWPVLARNTGLCKRRADRLGFAFFDLPNGAGAGAGDADATAARALDLELGASVDHVIPGSPLDTAGLKPGDRVVSIDGTPVATGRHAGRASNAILDRAIASAGTSAPVHLQILRGTQPLDIAAVPVTVCDYTLASVAIVGQFAQSKEGVIDLDPRVLNEATDDTDRTIVLAHALAHQINGSAGKRNGLLTAGRALDVIGGLSGHTSYGLFSLAAGAVSHGGGSEEPADALSVQLLAPLGIPAWKVVAFWERYADAPGQDSLLGRLNQAHPMNPERMEKLRAIARAQADAVPPAVGGSVAHAAAGGSNGAGQQ